MLNRVFDKKSATEAVRVPRSSLSPSFSTRELFRFSRTPNAIRRETNRVQVTNESGFYAKIDILPPGEFDTQMYRATDACRSLLRYAVSALSLMPSSSFFPPSLWLLPRTTGCRYFATRAELCFKSLGDKVARRLALRNTRDRLQPGGCKPIYNR